MVEALFCLVKSLLLGPRALALLLALVFGPAPPSSRASEIQVLGLPAAPQAQALAVERDGRISVYADRFPISWLFWGLRRKLNGPAVSSKEPFDETVKVTITVHSLTWEQFFTRVLSGYSFVYTYRDGRIDRVRVLGEVPGSQHVAAVAIESKEAWRRREKALDEAGKDVHGGGEDAIGGGEDARENADGDVREAE